MMMLMSDEVVGRNRTSYSRYPKMIQKNKVSQF